LLLEEPLLPFDPQARSSAVEALVMSGLSRRYYRFRAGGFYGGIITADAVGCNFLCAYCWNYRRHLQPEAAGRFYSPEEVAENLSRLFKKTGLRQARLSGAEPILGESSFQHVIELVRLLQESIPALRFILETNGFILGRNLSLCRELGKIKRLVVRVCLKATDRDKFQVITGARREAFLDTLEALRNLKRYGVECWPAINQDLFEREELKRFQRFLAANYGCADLELEELTVYPFVEENLRKRGLALNFGHFS